MPRLQKIKRSFGVYWFIVTDLISLTVEPSVVVAVTSTGSVSPMFWSVIGTPAELTILAEALAVCPGLIAAGTGLVTNGCIPGVAESVSTCRLIKVVENALFPEFLIVIESHSSPFDCLMRLAPSTISEPLSEAVFAVDAYVE